MTKTGVRHRISLTIAAAFLVGCGAERPSDPAAKGGTLLYSAWPDAGNIDLFLVRVDGSGKHNLTQSSQFSEFDPDWSPDGHRIVFVKTGGPSWLFGDLFTMRADGSGETRLTSTPDIEESSPRWSPDGKTIAFVASGDVDTDRGFATNIYTMNARGGSRVRLTPFGAARSPSWSPDSDKIAFASGQRSKIFVMDVDGRNRRALTRGPYDSWPAWSPDGETIAFQRTPPFERDVFPNIRILLVPSEGGAPTLVREFAAGGDTDPLGPLMVRGWPM